MTLSRRFPHYKVWYVKKVHHIKILCDASDYCIKDPFQKESQTLSSSVFNALLYEKK